jgi:hypothetical protein
LKALWASGRASVNDLAIADLSASPFLRSRQAELPSQRVERGSTEMVRNRPLTVSVISRALLSGLRLAPHQ